MLARMKCRAGERDVGGVGGGDDHQFDVGVRKQLLGAPHHADAGQVTCYLLLAAGDHGGEPHARLRLHQRRVEDRAGKPVADQSDGDLVHPTSLISRPRPTRRP